jgi:hypothetical protein
MGRPTKSITNECVGAMLFEAVWVLSMWLLVFQAILLWTMWIGETIGSTCTSVCRRLLMCATRHVHSGNGH